jgi:hypothetical protein
VPDGPAEGEVLGLAWCVHGRSGAGVPACGGGTDRHLFGGGAAEVGPGSDSVVRGRIELPT